ncbi:hypothetical protein JY651_49605 [Pyxidicoccus parkwayensis]|uniref:Uncharacterized protein n=1 Tax=Pyxidicoccus parkwayensis TaxID=2813578 RepID=A0ABX7NXA2_9BACT|nr:hypothetical protein [Pyxidicoccus parkwaysis]QSQ23061.1 hypothetical protein JY651_49605 [Pyxidicoccus parkwaysis]
MPRAFDITSVTDTIRLDSAGQGEVAFTVSNALRAPVRARATVVPDSGAKAEWFTIDGAGERDFPTDGTQQYAVKVRVPPGTPPGRCTFHLLVVDVESPDERYAEGPSTAFEVVVSTPVPKKPFPWIWVALAAGVVIILGTVIGIIASRGGKPELKEPCPEGACDKGLTCTAQDGGVCLLAAGQACDGGALCYTGFCNRSGTCELPLGETCTTDANCSGPLKCTAVLGNSICLLKPDSACERDSDCSSFFCRPDGKCNRDDGRCDTDAECRSPSTCSPTKLCQLPNGQQCTRNETCLSGFCANTCQPAPITFQCPSGCPPFSACSAGRCLPISSGTMLNKDALLAAPKTREGIQQYQMQRSVPQ